MFTWFVIGHWLGLLLLSLGC